MRIRTDARDFSKIVLYNFEICGYHMGAALEGRDLAEHCTINGSKDRNTGMQDAHVLLLSESRGKVKARQSMHEGITCGVAFLSRSTG